MKEDPTEQIEVEEDWETKDNWEDEEGS